MHVIKEVSLLQHRLRTWVFYMNIKIISISAKSVMILYCPPNIRMIHKEREISRTCGTYVTYAEEKYLMGFWWGNLRTEDR